MGRVEIQYMDEWHLVCLLSFTTIIEEQTHTNNHTNDIDNNSILVNLRLVKVVCCLTINCLSHLCKNEASMPVKGLQVRRRKCFLYYSHQKQKKISHGIYSHIILNSRERVVSLHLHRSFYHCVSLSEKGLCMFFRTKIWTHKPNNEANASSHLLATVGVFI